MVALLEKISRNDAFKEMIAAEGGIQVVIEIGITRHIATKEIVKLCLSTLANLAFNSARNIGRIMAAGGVAAVELAMQTCACARCAHAFPAWAAPFDICIPACVS